MVTQLTEGFLGLINHAPETRNIIWLKKKKQNIESKFETYIIYAITYYYLYIHLNDST